MLVLTRKPGDYIVINDNTFVRVVNDKSGRLKIQIEAPDDVKILRGELYEEQERKKLD